MNYSVLLVDDDDEDFMLLRSHIKTCHQDISLTCVHNGLEAIQELTQGLCPNLIVVDAQMPLMNGYELLVWLMNSENWRHIPVVIWTGAISPSEVTRYYRAGANSLILKQDTMQDVNSFCHHWFKLVQLPELVWDKQE